MDDPLIRFRQAADGENHRRPLRRRHSSELQQQAVAYWRQRRGQEGVRTIAAALGVSVSTLQRWARGGTRRPRFRPVAVVERTPAMATGPTVVVQITAAGPRVEGLTVETAARLLTLLR
jgi:transposase-like protein